MGRRNPNGYGSVTKLKGNRSKPWIIKVTQYDADGNGHQVPIGYTATEEEGNILLAKYNNNPWNIEKAKVTLAELYQQWAVMKKPKLGIALQRSLQSAYNNHLQKYYGMKYRNIKAYHMQDAIDSCTSSHATQSVVKNLWGHLDRYAYEQDVIDKMYSQLISVSMAPPDTEARTPFTDEQIEALWSNQNKEKANIMLLYLYTGFRLNELLSMKKEQVNMDELYFQGGLKTASGKSRIVPIHHRILPIVQNLMQQEGTYLITANGIKATSHNLYTWWKATLSIIGIDPEDSTKTPHAARHTVETRLDNEKANRKCIDLLLGHKSKDIGNRVYNHKTIEQLRETIELLK